jgi:hypothetical protein
MASTQESIITEPIVSSKKRQNTDDSSKTESNKKQKVVVNTTKPKKICMMEDFDVRIMKFSPIVKSSKCNIVPMCHDDVKNSPILVQISGGGKIPPFGIDVKEEDANKINITLQISSEDDFEHMKKVRDELITVMNKNWTKWHGTGTKKPSTEVIENFCNHFTQPRKPKRNSPTEFWDSLSKASLNKNDILGGRCRITDVETGEKVDATDLAGRNWHKAVFELKHIYILGTKSFGISKTLRYLSTSREEDNEELEPL